MERIKNFVTHPITQLIGFIFTIGGSFVSNIVLNEKIWSILLFIGSCIFGGVLYPYIRRVYQAPNIIRLYNDTLSQCAKKLTDTNGVIRNGKIQSRAELKPYLNEVCAQIRKAIETLYFLLSGKRRSFAICIKEIITPEIYNSDPSTWSTQTIARVCDNLVDRENLDNTPQQIVSNTSFYESVVKNLSPWTSRNLIKTQTTYHEAHNDYLNPDTRFLEFYRSTIVVPIKQQESEVSQVIKELDDANCCENIHYLGFLCIDSLETFDDNDKNFEILIIFATIFAQLFYPFFEEYLVNKIQKVEEKK